MCHMCVDDQQVCAMLDRRTQQKQKQNRWEKQTFNKMKGGKNTVEMRGNRLKVLQILTQWLVV